MESIIRKLIKLIEKLPANFNEREDLQGELWYLLDKDKISFSENTKVGNIKPDFLIKDKKGNPVQAIELKVRQIGETNANPIEYFSECGTYHGGRDNIYQCKKLLGIKKGTVIYVCKINNPKDSKINNIRLAKNKVCNPKKYSFIKMYYLEFLKKKFYKGLLIHNGKITSQII